ncbi:hypothetical protein QNA08_03590 [Chelatococcus sp. SYSU_G07232]|uniref:Uncharacterized protein n=1 Tax=Chelatococcus albus TaxID=3047466 RepID=A0ABT7AD64_9HYPH|nr:hypothetical protein [Chelatococcus sp. SYSU_G07232]MDJ1157320.1 hypothetical protein [Chelatococcus sp. SYSU_G07232]
MTPITIRALVCAARLAAIAMPAGVGAQAASSHIGKRDVVIADKDLSAPSGTVPEQQSVQATTRAPDASSCLRMRQKVFLEGRGWVVRNVTLCN